jgi:hypothetical protein
MAVMGDFTRKDFLHALFGAYFKRHKGWMLVYGLRQNDPNPIRWYFPDINNLAQEAFPENMDIYFGACPHAFKNAGVEAIRHVVCLWANLDIGSEPREKNSTFYESPTQAADAIRSLPIPPSIIVESGRGAHLYWLLKQPVPVEDPSKIAELRQAISERLRCDPCVDLRTKLRLPDTVNWKIRGKPVNCETKFINTNFVYDLDDFVGLENKSSPLVRRQTSHKATAREPGRPGRQTDTLSQFNK